MQMHRLHPWRWGFLWELRQSLRLNFGWSWSLALLIPTLKPLVPRHCIGALRLHIVFDDVCLIRCQIWAICLLLLSLRPSPLGSTENVLYHSFGLFVSRKSRRDEFSSTSFFLKLMFLPLFEPPLACLKLFVRLIGLPPHLFLLLERLILREVFAPPIIQCWFLVWCWFAARCYG